MRRRGTARRRRPRADERRSERRSLRVNISERAHLGVARIGLYVSERFSNAVERQVFERLQAAFAQIAEFPESRHRRPDFRGHADLRFWSVGPALIAYRFDGETIEIIAVERGDQDWTTTLDVSSE